MNYPLVTVICVCYNHARFVEEALNSVVNQTYPNIELIVIDDGSTDGSGKLIKRWVAHQPKTIMLLNGNNLGYCKTFNKAFALARGEFIIDFAADDVMLPEKIDIQVKHFLSLDKSYGVIFSDATYIDEEGNWIRNHFDYLFKKGLLKEIPQGDVYASLLSSYFIPSPSMMVRKEVLEQMAGYDDDLAYEDFDFWIRSSRICKYGFIDKKLVKIRRGIASMSTGWYKKNDLQLLSTYQVCLKAILLNRNTSDWAAWTKRVRYELRQSVFSENKKEANLFFDLLKQHDKVFLTDSLLFFINRYSLPLAPLRNLYHRLRFGA